MWQLFFFSSSNRVDGDFQTLLAHSCHSAVLNSWRVHLHGSGLCYRRLEDHPINHSCFIRCLLSLHMVCTFAFFLRSSTTLIDGNVSIRFLPESARWFLNRGRTEEAKQLIYKVAKINKRNPPPFQQGPVLHIKKKKHIYLLKYATF